MFCESASSRVESASRVSESSQRVGESPVSPGSKILTVLYEFLGTFSGHCFGIETRRDSESTRRDESRQRVGESENPQILEVIWEKNSENFGRTSSLQINAEALSN